jgi:hypothetical protein
MFLANPVSRIPAFLATVRLVLSHSAEARLSQPTATSVTATALPAAPTAPLADLTPRSRANAGETSALSVSAASHPDADWFWRQFGADAAPDDLGSLLV